METDLGLQSASLSDFADAREGADFFQIMRTLEELKVKSNSDSSPAIKLSGNMSMGFSSSLLDRFEFRADEDAQPTADLALNDYHLASSRSTLPDHFIELVQEQVADGNLAPKAFLDIFNDVVISQLYEIRRDFDPALFNSTQRDSDYFKALDSFLDLRRDSKFAELLFDLLSLKEELDVDRFGESRASCAFLSDQLEKILDSRISIDPFMGSWIPTPNQYQMRLESEVKLDGSRALGTRHWSNESAILLEIECDSRDFALSLMPNGAEHQLLLKTLALLTECNFGVLVVTRVTGESWLNCKLGSSLLGYDSWIGKLGVDSASVRGPGFFVSVAELMASIGEGSNGL